tara:strand:+ start:348 stop:620 length:273 start_codon:yes stop_codon:yes gene_type:complete
MSIGRYCIIYVVRYEDSDVEFCSFYQNRQDATKGLNAYKRQFGKVGSLEKKKVKVGKKGFLGLYNKFAIQTKQINDIRIGTSKYKLVKEY